MKNIGHLLQKISGLKPGEEFEYKDPDTNFTIIFEGQKKDPNDETRNKTKVQQKLKLLDLGILLDSDDSEEAIITKLRFYNLKNDFIKELTISSLLWNQITLVVDEKKISISERLKDCSAKLEEGFLNYLLKECDGEYIGIITHQKKEKIEVLRFDTAKMAEEKMFN